MTRSAPTSPAKMPDPLHRMGMAWEAVTAMPPTGDRWMSCKLEQQDDVKLTLLDMCDQLGEDEVLSSYDSWLRDGNRRTHLFVFTNLLQKRLRASDDPSQDPSFSPSFSGACDHCPNNENVQYDHGRHEFLCLACSDVFGSV